MTSRSENQDEIESPCNKICKIGQDHLCVGCLRSIEEIAAWGGLARVERLAVLSRIELRKVAAIEHASKQGG